MPKNKKTGDGPALYEEEELATQGRKSGRRRMPSLFDEDPRDNPYGALVSEDNSTEDDFI